MQLHAYEHFYWDLKTNDKPSTIHFVRKFDSHSVPCVVNQNDYAVPEEDTRIDKWNLLGEKLADLGVKQIIYAV